MRTVLALALAASLSNVPFPVSARVQPGIAPADEYFGRFHASILEIRNRLNRLDARRDRDMRDPRVVTELNAIADEVADWQTKYPADPWLPPMRQRLARNYRRAGTNAGVHIAAVEPMPDTVRGPEPRI